MNFIKAVESTWQKNNSLVCVGLDSDVAKIPLRFQDLENPLFEFNKAIVDATTDLVCAYKPQIAYYSASSAEQDLILTIDYIHRNYPGIPVILDAKRGDIGATSEKYVQEVFDRYKADAVTVNPYLGFDALQPFLNQKDKGVIILCRTSNPGARDIQDLESNRQKLYQIVAFKAVHEWNDNGNVLLVVGATFPGELKEIRTIVGDMPLLVPGIGAQGGDVEKAVVNGKSRNGTGMIINSSRGIIYAGQGDDFARAAREATMSLRDQINQFR
ncbi:MAG: orotidine-5'-phosphate decarboxylase [Deltaproteobacteria bacterium]|nr:orotidine-5'-phosphate decarboxylase [Deltaproteobacteria bacterium]